MVLRLVVIQDLGARWKPQMHQVCFPCILIVLAYRWFLDFAENADPASWFDLFSGTGINNAAAKSPRQGTSWERGAGGDLAAIFGASAGTSNDGSSNKEEGSNASRDRKSDIKVRSAGGTTEKSGSGAEDVTMKSPHGDPESAKAKDKPKDEKGDSNSSGGKESAN